ncbi:hypothetical protein SVIOM74S_03792 [Streptomyces violarus]
MPRRRRTRPTLRYVSSKRAGLGREVVTGRRFCKAWARARVEISVPSSSARSPRTTVRGTAVMPWRSIVRVGR